MRKLTITVDSPSRFTTVVTDNGEELNRRQYSDGANCSYSKHSRDMERPYVADALRSIICRYMVHEIEADEAGFEAEFCSGLATYTQYPSLLDENVPVSRQEGWQ